MLLIVGFRFSSLACIVVTSLDVLLCWIVGVGFDYFLLLLCYLCLVIGPSCFWRLFAGFGWLFVIVMLLFVCFTICVCFV